MKIYQEKELFRLGKRDGNKKRKFLLIDPLQAKHLPVSPTKSFEMMNDLSLKINEKIGENKRILVISFAETATAIGSFVASKIPNSLYIQTTREFDDSDKKNWLFFTEDHSHAVDQKINRDFLEKNVNETDEIVLIDDEISTGKTVLHLYDSIVENIPEFKNKKLILASIINAMSEDKIEEFKTKNIDLVYLIRINKEGFEEAVNKFDIVNAKDIKNNDNYVFNKYQNWFSKKAILDPRYGVKTKDFIDSNLDFINDYLDTIKTDISNKNILVLGTEECMYPAILFGQKLEEKFGVNVKTHSTTRSPIGVLNREDYPIKTGYKIRSLYDKNRETFIYNLAQYDKCFIVTDSYQNDEGIDDLIYALKENKTTEISVLNIGFGFGSYRHSDVTPLLTDITNKVEPMSNAEREKRIQNGCHYSEMLPIEYVPTQDYFNLYEKSLKSFAKKTCDTVATLSKKIIEKKGKNVVLVSLARAGTPVGILLKRYIKFKYNLDVPHYTISIIRGRGIDHNAMKYILDRHEAKDIQFIDGWTGKGAIARELKKDMLEYEGVDSGLAVLGDPAYISSMCGTHDDFIIPSSCLNSTVSGLLSRTFYRTDIIKENQFHGSTFYREMSSHDVSYEFINTVQEHFKDAEILPEEINGTYEAGLSEVKEIAAKYGIDDINLVKPSIGEATRVLLRRIPWKLLVNSLDDYENLGHLYQLAKEKGVELVLYPLKYYRACGIIKNMADN